jgi:hypothetical protein
LLRNGPSAQPRRLGVLGLTTSLKDLKNSVAFLTAFASLLHLLLIFPKRKRVMEKKNAGKLIYLPVAAFALLGIIIFTPKLPVDRLRTPAAIFLGLIFNWDTWSSPWLL